MKIEIYSKEGCPYCQKAIKVCELKNWQYTEYKLDRDFLREEFLEKFPTSSTFPRILIDGKLIGGFTEFATWVKSL